MREPATTLVPQESSRTIASPLCRPLLLLFALSSPSAAFLAEGHFVSAIPTDHMTSANNQGTPSSCSSLRFCKETVQPLSSSHHLRYRPTRA